MTTLLPRIPAPLAETSAAALEWPRLRETVAARTVSPLGRAWILALEPTSDPTWIGAQQTRTADVRSMLAAGGSFDFRGLFDPTSDLEEARIEGTALEATAILALLTLAERVAAWRALIDPRSQATHYTWPSIADLSAPLLPHDLAPLLRTLRGKIEPDGTLSDDASPELRRIRRATERQHRAIEESLRRAARKLRDEGASQEDLITVRGDRFVIPVKAEWKRRVPGVIHGSSSTGATVFVEPLETIEQNNELVRLLDEELAEIHRILIAMTRALGQNADPLHLGTAILAEAESHFARARFANDLRCTRPTFTPDQTAEINLVAARHPLLELRMRAEATAPPQTAVILSEAKDPRISLDEPQNPGAPSFPVSSERVASYDAQSDFNPVSPQPSPVPLTLILPPDSRQLIISGPNTGGKTVSLKTLGLLAVMAQAGLPIPAESATLPLFHAVFADIGDAQSIERNLSSFSAHVTNLDRISRTATPNSLVLLDELGSATDPEEGAALAVAIASHFLRQNCWSVITTHLTSLKVYAANHRGVLNAAVGFNADTLTPTYELRLGVPGASAGLNIAARLGMSADIITAARAQLTTQTADIGAFLDSLHDQLTAATAERERLGRRERELTFERNRLETEGRLEQKQRTRDLEKKLTDLIGDFESQLKDTVKAIDDKTVAQKIARDSALRVARLRREFSEQFSSTVVAHNTGADRSDTPLKPKSPPPLKPGDFVTLRSLNGREARVNRVLDDKNLEVVMGQLKMRIPRSDIASVTPLVVTSPAEAARRRGGITVQTSADPDTLSTEINVIGRTADEAQEEVERFVDRAFLAGLPRVRVVHGTGMGVLRRTLRDYLRKHPHVTGVTEPPHNEGGQGATLVELRQ